jgi:hypothetical protein
MARVWAATGHDVLAQRARRISTRLGTALRRAVAQEEAWLPDGSLFVPLVLGAEAEPYGRITFSRLGSYWNLLMPYAFASGFFAPHSVEADAILRYLDLHGARFLGVTRADAHISYQAPGVGQGLGQVYGLESSRFLADNDQSDELALGLYGMLAAGMTSDTYVSGEAISVLPVAGSYIRTMYMPPNLGANSTYLETLNLTLVHETRDARGAPSGLELGFSTPRAWLADGGHFGVRGARSSFGRLSYEVRRDRGHVDVRLDVPRAPSVRLRLRLPLGTEILSVRDGSRLLRADADGTVALPDRGRIVLVATVATSPAAARPPRLH